MSDNNKTPYRLVSLMLVLSIISLFLEYGAYQARWVKLFTNVLDYAVFLLFIADIALRYINSKYRIFSNLYL